MHRKHDHRHRGVRDHHHDDAGLGHNHLHKPRGVAEWQAPPLNPRSRTLTSRGEPDLDQVAAAPVEGVMAASDPTSFPAELAEASGQAAPILPRAADAPDRN